MTRKLHLHAGAPKTGSSALQLYFHTNAEALAEHGIRYPPGPAPDPKTLISSGNGCVITNGKPPVWKMKETRTQLVDDGTGRDVLISSEHCAAMDIPEIARLSTICRELDLELVPFLFIRDAEDWYQSAYQQVIKRHGFTGSFLKFIDEQPRRYPPALTVERYEAALPKGTLHIYSYEAAADLATYTMRRVFGIEPPGEWDNPTVNRSLTKREVTDLIHENLNGNHGFTASDAVLAKRPTIPTELRFSEPIPEWLATILRPDIDYLQTKLTPPETIYVTAAERLTSPSTNTDC